MSIDFAAPNIQRPITLHTLHGATMGTRYGVQFFAPACVGTAEIKTSLQSAVDHVDNQMSPWKPTSDLMRINKSAEHEWISICPETMLVIQSGLSVEAQSGGAFNIAVGNAVNAWGFGAGPELNGSGWAKAFPTTRATRDLLTIDHEAMRVRKNASITLDLCGIAKGFGVDQLAAVLGKFGIESYCVAIDGETRISGEKPDGGAWRIGLEAPAPASRNLFCVLEISDIALATSGDYRHFKHYCGRTISHTMNAQTGMPAENTLTSVTVATERCHEADAWATAFMAMGKDLALRCAEAQNLDALLVEKNEDQLVLHKCGNFAQMLS